MKNFVCCVLASRSSPFCSAFRLRGDGGAAEVAQACVEVAVEENVGGLQVVVGDPPAVVVLRVQEPQSVGDLSMKCLRDFYTKVLRVQETKNM